MDEFQETIRKNKQVKTLVDLHSLYTIWEKIISNKEIPREIMNIPNDGIRIKLISESKGISETLSSALLVGYRYLNKEPETNEVGAIAVIADAMVCEFLGTNCNVSSEVIEELTQSIVEVIKKGGFSKANFLTMVTKLVVSDKTIKGLPNPTLSMQNLIMNLNKFCKGSGGVVFIREPGGTEIAEKMRELLRSNNLI